MQILFYLRSNSRNSSGLARLISTNLLLCRVRTLPLDGSTPHGAQSSPRFAVFPISLLVRSHKINMNLQTRMISGWHSCALFYIVRKNT
jgi:hypothetical protein